MRIALDRSVKNGIILEDQKDYWLKKDAQVKDLKLGNFRFWKNMIDSAGWIILIIPLICVGTAPVFAGEIPEQGGFSAADHAIWEEQTGRRENTDGISLCNSSLLGDHSGLFRDLSYDMRSPGRNSSHTGI